MAEGVLLDTSFLITLAKADGTRPNHEAARRYFDLFAADGHLMYLSTIVASEFHLRQPLAELPEWRLSNTEDFLTETLAALRVRQGREEHAAA